MFWKHRWKLFSRLSKCAHNYEMNCFKHCLNFLSFWSTSSMRNFCDVICSWRTFLKNSQKKISTKKIVFSILNVVNVINESHLRILNAIDVHAIRHETYLENLNTFFKKNVEFMLILCLIKIEIFYQFLAFVTKNIFKKVLRSQWKFRKTRHFQRVCVRHFINDANNIFFWKHFSKLTFFHYENYAMRCLKAH
jgi:hypothetical protein